MPAGDDLLEDQGRELLGEFCEKPRHAPAVRTEVRRVSHEEAQGHQHRPDLARNGGLPQTEMVTSMLQQQHIQERYAAKDLPDPGLGQLGQELRCPDLS